MDNFEGRERQGVANASRAIWALSALMLVALVIVFQARGLQYDLRSGLSFYLIVGACLAVAFVYRRWRPDPWISHGAETTAQLLVLFFLGLLMSYPLASLAFPYRDAELHAIDNWLGLDWREYLRFFNDHPAFATAGRIAYVSMRPQFLAVILLLIATSRFARAQQYVLAITISLLITLLIFTFVPAVAAYSFLQISEAAYVNLTPSVPYEHIRHLEAMRTGAHFIISEGNLEGMITFPSYHTACAVIFMWALFPIPVLRWAIAALNLAMIASTPIEGAHYFIDILGGIVVALVAIRCAGALLPRLSATNWFALPVSNGRRGTLGQSAE